MEFSSWAQSNWFSIVQAVGIIGSLLFAGYTVRENTKSRRISNLLTLTEHHWRLWSQFDRKPALHRLLVQDRDMSKEPLTAAELRFLYPLFVHFDTAMEAQRAGELLISGDVTHDVKQAFEYPAIMEFWSLTSGLRKRPLLQWIEKITKSSTSSPDRM